jgi:hypothetical protein
LIFGFVFAQSLDFLFHLVQRGRVVDVILALGDEFLARTARQICGVRGDRARFLEERARVHARSGERDARAEVKHAPDGHGRVGV